MNMKSEGDFQMINIWGLFSNYLSFIVIAVTLAPFTMDWKWAKCFQERSCCDARVVLHHVSGLWIIIADFNFINIVEGTEALNGILVNSRNLFDFIDAQFFECAGEKFLEDFCWNWFCDKQQMIQKWI